MSDLTVWAHDHYQVLKDFAGPVATVLAAFTAIGLTSWFNKRQLEVSKTQRDIALDKLKFDIFELRYAIYLAAKEMIEYVSNKSELADVDSVKIRAMNVKLDEARFFFDADVVKFTQEIVTTVEQRLLLMAERERCTTDDLFDAWEALADKLSAGDIHLREMYAEIPQVFETALRFDQLVKKA